MQWNNITVVVCATSEETTFSSGIRTTIKFFFDLSRAIDCLKIKFVESILYNLGFRGLFFSLDNQSKD